jgi:DNA-binding response OmpR family regulator
MNGAAKIPLRILIVEDDPDILNALNVALGSMGFEVDVLLNGQGILSNRFTVPDLFILDDRLPDVNGLEICRFLKSKINYKDIPVIIISAGPKIEKTVLEAGASGFLAKPFEMQTLAVVVKQALHLPENEIIARANHHF